MIKRIKEYITTKELNLTATIHGYSAYKDVEFIIISTPTNYDTQMNFFDTLSVEEVIERVMEINPQSWL